MDSGIVAIAAHTHSGICAGSREQQTEPQVDVDKGRPDMDTIENLGDRNDLIAAHRRQRAQYGGLELQIAPDANAAVVQEIRQPVSAESDSLDNHCQ